MEFLKSILGDELYEAMAAKLKAHNELPDNKDKQVKLANLGEGAYVGKEKYASLETDYNSKIAELKTANELIAGMKKESKGSEELQTKIGDYEAKITALKSELNTAKLESAIKVALLEAKATDIDYMTFKLKEKGELALDEQGHIKGIEDKITGLKTQFPNQFEGVGQKKIDENKLGGGETPQELNKKELLKMSYSDRVKLYQENPDAFNEAMEK